jgi:hypothetical protein
MIATLAWSSFSQPSFFVDSQYTRCNALSPPASAVATATSPTVVSVLATLPSPILYYISTLLEPRDNRAFRQTCSVFHQLPAPIYPHKCSYFECLCFPGIVPGAKVQPDDAPSYPCGRPRFSMETTKDEDDAIVVETYFLELWQWMAEEMDDNWDPNWVCSL